MRYSWSAKEVDDKLKDIMINFFSNIYKTATKYGDPYDLLIGTNMAGFEKVADAVLSQGII